MNNIKKTVLGMLIAALAFGISAFTTVRNGAIVRYYKTDTGFPAANDPRGYEYYSGERCETGGNLCSAEWNIGTNPAPTSDGDTLPTGASFQEGSAMPGHFE
jgi:hypothetical protein